MRSIKDIKILLLTGYVIGYPLAVLPPILLDPILKSHVVFQSRHYVYALLCLPIYVLFLGVAFVLLHKKPTLRSLYISVCVFLIAILLSFPIFLPEFPHGNVFAVGVMTTFLSAFSIFIWSIGNQIAIDQRTLRSAGLVTLEYMKMLFSFVRQGAFAAVALFGALFFAAYATGFKFVEAIVTDKSDLFLLNLNLNLQIAFYVIYLIVGVVRYFFIMNLHILSQFKNIATRLDRKDSKSSVKKPD